MSDNKAVVPNYLGIFEQKLDHLRRRIQKELDLPKKERSKHHLKKMIKEANDLKRSLKQARKVAIKKCPHCGEALFD